MTWMIYGANGYTGELIVDEAVRRGEKPILAGRNADAITRLARDTGLEARVFSLGDAGEHLGGVDAVLHCAGPFGVTSAPMVNACIHQRVHYLDITGEIAVFEAIFRRDEAARAAGVVLMPGVGFDVVPTDCLAAKLHAEMPDAVELSLAFYTKGGTVSPGTLKTMISGMGEGGAIRRGGKIVRVPTAWDVRDIPFSAGVRTAMTIPWGDVSTAYRTTRIPDIRVYSGASPKSIARIRRMRPVMSLLRVPLINSLAQKFAGRKKGSDASQRARSRVYLWGEAKNAAGAVIQRTLEVPDGYTLTAKTAVEATRRVVSGAVAPGSWTPAAAFGAQFIDEVLE